MTCDDARVLMHGHLDGELDLAADLEVQQHIEQCPRCASEYAAMRAMRTRLKDPAFRFEAPAALKEKIRRAIPASPPSRAGAYPSRRGTWVPRAVRFAVPMAIGAMLALIVAPRTIGPALNQRLASEVVASHVRSLMAAHLMDVASTDQHTVKPWFNGKLDVAPPVIDLTTEGFTLIGGRLDDINGETVAALVYRRRHHVINLFVTRHPGSERARSGSEIRHGFNVRQWTADGLDFWAVSDINAGELDEFYKKFTAAAHPAAPS